MSVTAVLFCPAMHAENVARVDKGWTPAPGATRERMAWLTPQGERVEHASCVEWFFGVRGLRIHLGFGCDWRDIKEIRALARAGRHTIVGEEKS
ncbi:hypothetical protein NKH10_19370 [Mesorhizobium sp. M1340]|uniref:hypothetical protein n=1 Tax=Mesorhizobium sp. M1340 TaxID=2957087 RepID=UPI00333DAE2F